MDTTYFDYEWGVRYRQCKDNEKCDMCKEDGREILPAYKGYHRSDGAAPWRERRGTIIALRNGLYKAYLVSEGQIDTYAVLHLCPVCLHWIDRPMELIDSTFVEITTPYAHKDNTDYEPSVDMNFTYEKPFDEYTDWLETRAD